MGCVIILLVGCASQNGKSIDLGEEANDKGKEPVVVSGDEANEMMNNGAKSYVIVGDFATEKYNLLLENMIKVCKERDMKVYALNSADEKNAVWIAQNNITAEMNVAILSGGKQTIWDLQHEAEYQSGLLGTVLDGIIGKM